MDPTIAIPIIGGGKNGSDYWKSYYSGKNFPKNASDYCTAYIGYIRYFATYKISRNNTYRTTVQANAPDFTRFPSICIMTQNAPE